MTLFITYLSTAPTYLHIEQIDRDAVTVCDEETKSSAS